MKGLEVIKLQYYFRVSKVYGNKFIFFFFQIHFRFEEEKDNVKFAQNQNNLYRPPVSTFKNPMYGKGATS